MSDLKDALILDSNKISKSLSNDDKLGKLSKILKVAPESEYWKKYFKYNKDRCALESFLLYKVAGKFNLYEKGADDADITEPAMNALKERLKKLDNVKEVEYGIKYGKDRAFQVVLKDETIIYLESDIAHSLMGDLGSFLRIVLRREWGNNWPDKTYIDMYGLDRNKRKKNGQIDDDYYAPFRYFYFSSLISGCTPNSQFTIYDLLKDKKERECLNKLQKRAELTHTIKNVIFVPYGYNSFRAFGRTYKSRIQIKDRLDLTFKDFQEMKQDNAFTNKDFRQRLQNHKCTVESVRFLLKNQEVLFPTIHEFKGSAEKNDIQGILDRTEIINDTLEKA